MHLQISLDPALAPAGFSGGANKSWAWSCSSPGTATGTFSCESCIKINIHDKLMGYF